ncbi:MAG: hypothetical protein JNN15_03060 [Blastocatellia bacterium]|nr:hypothetical protein [Blastocatellia bacterium]
MIVKLRFYLLFLIFLFTIDYKAVAVEPTTKLSNEIAEHEEGRSDRTERLAALGRVWGLVKLFHPYLGYKNIDWDGAAIKAIAKVNAAKTSEEYELAVSEMLAVLNDPVTRVIHKDQEMGDTEEASEGISSQITKDGILIVKVEDYAALTAYQEMIGKFEEISEKLLDVRAVIFDLRSTRYLQPEEKGQLAILLNESGIESLLTPSLIFSPGERSRVHFGLRRQQGVTDTDYHSALYTKNGVRTVPDKEATEKKIIFVINEKSDLPMVALGLQSAGKAAIVSEGKMTDASVVRTQSIKMPGSFSVAVRLTELVYQDNTTGAYANVTVLPSTDKLDKAMKAALSLARLPRQIAVKKEKLAAVNYSQPDNPYANLKPLPAEYRLLAVFKIWNTAKYFFPYKHLIKENWDSLLPKFVEMMSKVENDQQYALTVSEIVTYLHDSHVYIPSKPILDYFGTSSAPISVRMIEGLPIVTEIKDESARTAGVEVGDVILKVDGEGVDTKIALYSKYLASSTPQGHMIRVLSRLLTGAEKSVLKLTVRDRNNQVKDIDLVREARFNAPKVDPKSPAYRILQQNIGYVDLSKLTISMVDAMFEALKDTKGIIFDMRGFPKGTAWEIAPRLTDNSNVAAALFEIPTVMNPESSTGEITDNKATSSFIQRLPRTEKWRYRAKTVMLIDERAISQAEHTGLMLKAANGTVFIGSSTTGADGEVTNFYVPGGLLIHFSGSSVSYPDGKQLQRVGLTPDIEVKPTISGLRAGRDEVLEAAIDYIQK